MAELKENSHGTRNRMDRLVQCQIPILHLTLLNYQVLPTHFGGILGYIQIRELQRHQCRMAIMVFQWLHLLHLEQVLQTCQTTIIKAELEATYVVVDQ